MLSYLDTIERLTLLRDRLREGLDNENKDRQYLAEDAEATLTTVLGELVTPSVMCAFNDCGAVAVGVTSETAEGVCQEHIFGALLMGHAVNTSPEALAKLMHN